MRLMTRGQAEIYNNDFEHSSASGWLSVFGLTSDVNLPDNHNLHVDDNIDVESDDINDMQTCHYRDSSTLGMKNGR